MSTAVVTGASSGIGLAVAERLCESGWWVRGISRSRPPIVSPRFTWWEHDVGVPMTQLSGDLDALVHAAAVRGPYGPFDENDPRAWARTIRTNLLGTARVVRACLPALKRAPDGRILLFSGGGAFGPEPGYSAYACTKAATVAFMETLAAEVQGTTVTVNCVAPGFVATAIHAGTPNEGRPDDGEALPAVVACVMALLGPATRGLTGKTVSARWDDWASIDQTTVAALNATEQGRRARHKIALVARLRQARAG